jgi:hypothetical protein
MKREASGVKRESPEKQADVMTLEDGRRAEKI